MLCLLMNGTSKLNASAIPRFAENPISVSPKMKIEPSAPVLRKQSDLLSQRYVDSPEALVAVREADGVVEDDAQGGVRRVAAAVREHVLEDVVQHGEQSTAGRVCRDAAASACHFRCSRRCKRPSRCGGAAVWSAPRAADTEASRPSVVDNIEIRCVEDGRWGSEHGRPAFMRRCTHPATDAKPRSRLSGNAACTCRCAAALRHERIAGGTRSAVQ